MFLHLSVILSTGVGCYLSMHCRWYPSMPCSRSPGGVWYPSMHCRWYPSMPCSRSPGVVSQHALQVSGPHPEGKLRGSGQGGSPGPHPRGELWEIWPGGCLQAHTQGFSRPTPGGVSRSTPGGVSRPTPGMSIPACTEADPPDGYCCSRYTSYRNAFLLSS